jgi:hypothetical protein
MQPPFVRDDCYQHASSVIQLGDDVAERLWANINDNVRAAIVNASPANVFDYVLARGPISIPVAMHAAGALYASSLAIHTTECNARVERLLGPKTPVMWQGRWLGCSDYQHTTPAAEAEIATLNAELYDLTTDVRIRCRAVFRIGEGGTPNRDTNWGEEIL